MSRYDRPPFDKDELQNLGDEETNRLLFDWWCDEGESDRKSDRTRYIESLKRTPTPIPSRAPRQNDPAPPVTEPAPQGFRDVYLLSNPADIRQALTETENFSNIPYAALGGASFLLGMDPGEVNGIDWHAEQRALVREALKYYEPAGLRVLANLAVKQAALTSLARPDFDLAQFAEQAALRYMGQLFGYGIQDHPLLEEASRATYRALQYLAIGQHFVTEPATLPAAQQALARLVARTSKLMDEYTQLARSPRRYGFQPDPDDWPEGVQPWSEIDLSSLGEPLLKRLPTLCKPWLNGRPTGSQLSGRDRATVAATLLAGTLGNIQSAVCLLTQSLLNDDAGKLKAAQAMDDDTLEADLEARMAGMPPVPVLPRRTRKEVELAGGEKIKPDTDCLLLLEGGSSCRHIWGNVKDEDGAPAMHLCLGRDVSLPLITALVGHTLRLRGVKPALDALTCERLDVERLWGFACTRYPLRYDREQVRAQQNLIVAMRVKSPVGENAARLRRLIAAAVPRIDHALKEFGNVHFAWFEFTDDDSQLVLRTIYDGQFEAYMQHFALHAGDLFDRLFEYLEDSPPHPVAEFPLDFVETIRRYNRTPLAGYLFSAHPQAEAKKPRRDEEEEEEEKKKRRYEEKLSP